MALAAVVVLLGATTASADLHDFGVVTFDDSTGLEWLDLHETLNLSYDDVVNGVGNTFYADGWRHATTAEVCALLVEASIARLELRS